MSSVTSLLEQRAEGRVWNPKIACAVVLALVFLCGAAAGALVVDRGFHNRRTVAFDTAQGKAQYFDRLQKELDLTPKQSEEIQSILNDFWQLYRTVLSDGKVRIEQVLTPAQRQKFEHILQDAQR